MVRLVFKKFDSLGGKTEGVPGPASLTLGFSLVELSLAGDGTPRSLWFPWDNVDVRC